MSLQLQYTNSCPYFSVDDTSSALPETYLYNHINIIKPDGSFYIPSDNSIQSRVLRYQATGNPVPSFTVSFGCGATVYIAPVTTNLKCYLLDAVKLFNEFDLPQKDYVIASFVEEDGNYFIDFTSTHPAVYFNITNVRPDVDITWPGGTVSFSGTETQSILQNEGYTEYTPDHEGGLYTAYLYYYDTALCLTYIETIQFYNFCYDYNILNCCMTKLALKSLECRCEKYIPISARVREIVFAAKYNEAISQGQIALDLIKSAKYICNDCNCGGGCK